MELFHHGISGQKWGKRNGPPYPLDYNDHSAAEKKKNPKSQLDNYEDRINTKRNKKINDKYDRKIENRRESDKEEKHGLTDKQKKVLTRVAIGVGAAALAAGTAYVIKKQYDKNPDMFSNLQISKGKNAASQVFESPYRSLSSSTFKNKSGKTFKVNTVHTNTRNGSGLSITSKGLSKNAYAYSKNIPKINRAYETFEPERIKIDRAMVNRIPVRKRWTSSF